MSVLCCRVPDFLPALALRHRPELAARPFALLGPDERVWAASASARALGVQAQMAARQAQMRCPDLVLSPVDVQASQSEQAAFLSTLARWELPVEPHGWGLAYVDLHSVAVQPDKVQPLAAELGRRVRGELGGDLQPALGWDSGKFTARAAAVSTKPGRMRLVGKADEVGFLSPLPISLLPLPREQLQQLHWLGIRTLGQYAALPPAAVWQRWGQAGKTAQKWAQGRDDRPVRAQVAAAPDVLGVELDPPTALLPPVVEALLEALRPTLAQLSSGLSGCTRLRLALSFVDGEARTVDATFVEPASDANRIRAALTQRLNFVWPSELSRAQVAVIETGELPAGQLALLSDFSNNASPLADLAARLVGRYGPCFFEATVTEPSHPAPERRAHLLPLA